MIVDVIPPKKIPISYDAGYYVHKALSDLGYCYRVDYYVEPSTHSQSILKIYKQPLLQDKRVRELLVEYLI